MVVSTGVCKVSNNMPLENILRRHKPNIYNFVVIGATPHHPPKSMAVFAKGFCVQAYGVSWVFRQSCVSSLVGVKGHAIRTHVPFMRYACLISCVR